MVQLDALPVTEALEVLDLKIMKQAHGTFRLGFPAIAQAWLSALKAMSFPLCRGVFRGHYTCRVDGASVRSPRGLAHRSGRKKIGGLP
jgi:hypothetical protein